MKTFRFLFISIVVMALINTAFADNDAAEDRIIVKFRDSKKISAVSSKHGRVVERFNRSGLTLLKIQGSKSVRSTLDELRRDPSVLYAEPDYIIITGNVPDDTYYSDLWGLAMISLPGAWLYTTGSGSVVVAVIDTGVDYTHPDLAANAWVNPGEIPGNKIDDDGNGYVDDVYGYDFCNNDNAPLDDNGHGTHCAGIIGGTGFNAEGIIGVSPYVSIMALKFLASSGSGSTSAAIRCIEYAVANGADILSCSWGSTTYSAALLDAIKMAETYGVTVVAAAGNNTANADRTPFYPACYQSGNIISVGASTSDDISASFSNYGLTSVDVFAPGYSIISTYPGNRYRTFSGTSMAAPYVSGTLALCLSSDDSLTPAVLRNNIISTADTLSSYSALCVSGGRINAANMVINSNPSPYLDITTVMVKGGDGDSFAEPGETLQLYIEIINSGNVLRDSYAELVSTNSNVVVLSGNSTYPDVLTGGRCSNTEAFTIWVKNVSGMFSESGLVLEIVSRFTGHKERIEVPLFTGSQCYILLVDDDGGSITEKYIEESLQSLGLNYTVWDTQKRGTPPLTVINPSVTIWNTGNMQGEAITGSELDTISTYASSGGSLLLAGDEWADMLVADTFISSIMKVSVTGTDILPEEQVGTGSFEGINFPLPSIAIHRDRLSPLDGASLLCRDLSSSVTGSISISHTSQVNGPLAGAAFDISTLDTNTRQEVIGRIMNILSRPVIVSVSAGDSSAETSLRMPQGSLYAELKIRHDGGTENIITASDLSQNITGLVNNETYYVSARAVYNGDIRSEWSGEKVIVPAADGKTPLQGASGLTYTADGEGLIFTWQGSPDPRVVSYNIEINAKNGRAGFFTTASTMFRLDCGYIDASDSGTVTLYTVDSSGNTGRPVSINWSYNDFYPPVDVTGITLTRLDANTVAVTWNNTSSSDLKRYTVEIQDSSRQTISMADTGTGTTAMFSNVSDGVKSYILIRCEDNSGNVSPGSLVSWGDNGRGGKIRHYCGCMDENESDGYKEAGIMAISLNHLCNLLLTSFGVIITALKRFINKRRSRS